MGQMCLEPEVFLFGSGYQPVDLGTQVAAFSPRNSRSFESRASQFCPIERRFCSVMVKLARLHYYDFCGTLQENKSWYKGMFVSEMCFLSQMFFSASSKMHSELSSPVSSAGRTMRSL